MAKLLLVDDDRELLALISEALRFEHHNVETAFLGVKALDMLSVSEFDAIILDWSLPDMSGLDILKHIRAKGGNTPVLMLTGKTRIEDRTTGLDSGADDYLIKPFHVKELVSRIKALVRRSSNQTANTLKAGCLELDPQTFKVKKDGVEVHIPPLDFRVLEFLMRHPNKPFSGETLITKVWSSDAEVGNETVRTCIKRLRQKLGEHDGQDLIQTVHGLGYRLNVRD
jgi:two-component system OmpR family response regulator